MIYVCTCSAVEFEQIHALSCCLNWAVPKWPHVLTSMSMECGVRKGSTLPKEQACYALRRSSVCPGLQVWAMLHRLASDLSQSCSLP